MVQLQRSIMYTGLLSVVRYCGGVVNSGVHTLTVTGVGHLCVCVCVFVNKYGLQHVIIIWVQITVCVCVCLCAVCMHVCVHGSDGTGRRGRREHEELHHAQLEIADCNLPPWRVAVLQT